MGEGGVQRTSSGAGRWGRISRMGAAIGRGESRETVTVRYWAGAKAAAGTAEDAFEVDRP